MRRTNCSGSAFFFSENGKEACGIFCGRRSDRIKGILFEGDGFLLLYKRLIPGFRYQWPRTAKEARELTPEQYTYLMQGFNPLQEGLIGEVSPERLA